jgi:hypothetical protein
MEVSGQPHVSVALAPVKEPSVPIEWEAGWAPEPIWTFERRDKSLAPAGIRVLGRIARSLITILAFVFIY